MLNQPMKALFRKLYVTIAVLLSMPAFLSGQDMSVKSFFLAETDLTANTRGEMKYDQNGNICALIKVETTLDGFTFDVGTLGIVDLKREGGELWVYVPYGIRKITISHPQLGVIRDYMVPCQIEKGRTYILKLNTSLGNRVYDSSKKQKVILQVSPTQATVEINGLSMSPDPTGKLVQEYSFGFYEFVVSHPDYHTKIEQVQVNSPDKPHYVTVSLKPRFGWLMMGGEGDETLYIDNVKQSFTPNRIIELSSGSYLLRMEKPLHKPYETTINIKDSLSLALNPVFEPIFRNLTLTVDDDAEIWMDGEMLGKGKYQGNILYGTYQIECRKSRYTPSQMTLVVEPNTRSLIILPSPEPTFNELQFTVENDAEIWVDDTFVGKGRYQSKMDFGSYVIECRKENHRSTREIVVVDSKTVGPIVLEAPQPMYGTLHVNSSQPNSDVYVNGRYVGKAPWMEKKMVGAYSVVIKKSGYDNYTQSIIISEKDTCRVYAALNPEFYVKISTSSSGASLSIDGEYIGNTPCNAEVTAGYHDVRLSMNGYRDKSKRVLFDEPGKEYDFRMSEDWDTKKQRWEDNQESHLFYNKVGEYELSHTTGPNPMIGLHLALYYKNIYFAADAKIAYSEIKQAFAFPYDNYQDDVVDVVFTPGRLSLQLGYCFNFAHMLQIVPEVGLGRVKLRYSESDCEGKLESVDMTGVFTPEQLIAKRDSLDSGAERIKAFSPTIGLRLNFAPVKHIQFSIVPEYHFLGAGNENFRLLSEHSPIICQACSGFRLRFALAYYFTMDEY